MLDMISHDELHTCVLKTCTCMVHTWFTSICNHGIGCISVNYRVIFVKKNYKEEFKKRKFSKKTIYIYI